MVDDVFFDAEKEIVMSRGGMLPHWHQDGKIQFVTFRLGDSLPQERIAELRNIVQNFKREHSGKNWSEETWQKYNKLIGRRTETLLDNGYGSCILRRADCRECLSEAIDYMNGVKYEMIAYVIMPNHVHMLLMINDDETLHKIIKRIKSFSARRINHIINGTGSVWMSEYYDRIVRGRRDLMHYIDYIKSNPRILPPGDFKLFIHPAFL